LWAEVCRREVGARDWRGWEDIVVVVLARCRVESCVDLSRWTLDAIVQAQPRCKHGDASNCGESQTKRGRDKPHKWISTIIGCVLCYRHSFHLLLLLILSILYHKRQNNVNPTIREFPPFCAYGQYCWSHSNGGLVWCWVEDEARY
jgi:hypothetical protein